jgi:neutral ceramidase
VYEGGASTGTLATPIDEYNAPVGAALCETSNAMFPAAAIPGTEGMKPYGSCLRLDVAGEILGEIFSIDFAVDDTHPVCESTRTTLSALRIGDYVFGTMPGELTVLLANYIRDHSPVGPDKTIVLGYAQGHVGYLLTPEDWLTGGYEPSITFWGPLEGEYLAEQLAKLLPLATTPMRENAATDSANKVKLATITDPMEIDDPAPMAGTVPASVPSTIWARTGTPPQAQPAEGVPRVSGIATFVWIGDDPNVKTPRVTLQYEISADSWAPVARKSGRLVEDAEIVLAYTPTPLQRSGPQTHYWVAEWQAVPWLGHATVDGLADRGGVPLGRYRFHVEGKGWSLDSAPFEVVPGGLNATATKSGANIQVGVRWHAPKGWRLMDMGLMSNQPVPVRSQQVKLELLSAADAVLATTTLATDGNGTASVADQTGATKVRVTDRFNNITVVNL